MSANHKTLQYEQALRAIGRHLDAEPVYQISMTEGPDGFVVRSQQSGRGPGTRSIEFGWDRLNDLVILQKAGRGLRKRPPRHAGLWANFPNGHEDYFRALGHILDAEGASGLKVDEVPEGIAVSYDRRVDGRTERQETTMHRADVEEMLREAQSRRDLQTA
ncbi:MAG TPA: hypothetical protein VFB58_07660 [Chloroflexota bacterium]|nr:hypothetical protein [Chloroflexota bacterium]